jgi:hypothetical protein
MTHPLVQYYVRQGDHGSYGPGDSSIGPIYSIPPFVQRGHCINIFLSGLFRVVRPLLWSGAKAVGRETLRTGGRILTDIAENKSPNGSAGDIVSKHVTESARNLTFIVRAFHMRNGQLNPHVTCFPCGEC